MRILLVLAFCITMYLITAIGAFGVYYLLDKTFDYFERKKK